MRQYYPLLYSKWLINVLYNLSVTGGARISTPMFTKFGDPLLAEIFSVLSDNSENSYSWTLKVLLPVLGSFPFVVITTITFFNFRKRTRRRHHPTIQPLDRKWRPWTMRLPFLSLLLISTVLLIITIIIHSEISALPDPNTSRKFMCWLSVEMNI